MKKTEILDAIRKAAETNDGVPLGRERFEQQTGIKESAWSGKYWTRWGDAVREAGYNPNPMNQPHPVEDLLRPLAELSLELGHFPTQPEMNLKRILLKKSQAGTYGWPDGSMRCANSIAIVESKSCLLDVVPRNGRLKPLQGRFVP